MYFQGPHKKIVRYEDLFVTHNDVRLFLTGFN
jgi:hypothetical protein